MSLLIENKSFQKKSLYYTPTFSVSLLTSVLNFQTPITAHVATLLSFMQLIEECLLAIFFLLFLILRTITSKSNDVV